MASLKPALNLMRRLPPASLEENLAAVVDLVPAAVSEELLARVDQPLVEATDTTANRKFLICDYNRDGDSFRSPWTRAYFPPIEDGEVGYMPSEKVHDLERDANALFDAYREQYFGQQHSLSSVYFWDSDDGLFSGCWLIKKHIPSGGRFVKSGCWDSIHVTEVKQQADRSFVYKLTTTVMLNMEVESPELGSVSLNGSLNRQVQQKLAAPKEEFDHVARLGQMIESMETDLRSNLDALYIAKTREVMGTLRTPSGAAMMGSSAHVAALTAAVKEVQAGRPVDSEV